MQLNDAGFMVEAAWNDLQKYYTGVENDAFVVMPNHIHGIIALVGTDRRVTPNSEGQPQGVAPTRNPAKMSLSDVVHRFKTLTTKRYIEGCEAVLVGNFHYPVMAAQLLRTHHSQRRIVDADPPVHSGEPNAMGV